MNIPCPNPVACPAGTDGDDALIANASIETPDVRMFFAYRYTLRSASYCAATTQLAADLCAVNPPANFDSETIYSSAAQTCIIDCSGSPVSYTIAAGAALGFSQAAADAAANALACTYAAIVCAGGEPTLVPNEAQACTITCPGGEVMTSTVPAGALLGLSLAEANASAYAIACQAAALQCPDNPPPTFGNVAVSSESDCPSGGTFTYHVAANTFFASTQGEANATAQSYADQQAVLQRLCLSDILGATCKDEVYGTFITVGSEPSSDFTWSIISGSLSPSFTFDAGLLTGDSTTAGVSTFTVKAVHNSTGNFTTRTYTLGVIEITSASPLPDGGTGSGYSVTLTQTGIPSTAVWSLGGSLPPGLSLSSAGVISGTPTSSGSYSFIINIVDSNSGLNCFKEFSLDIELNPLEWWKMVDLVGSVNGITMTGSSASFGTVGKYGTSTSLNSQGTPGNIQGLVYTAAPVTGLAYGGTGIDAFIWIDNPAGVINSDTIFLLEFTDSAGTVVWSMSFTIDNQVGVEYHLNSSSGGTVAMATSVNYRMFEIYYDPATTRLGIRVNNGAVMDQSIVVAAPAATAKGSITITYDRRTAGSSSALICEVAVYPAILSAAQRAVIYGGGAGVTWPVVLP